MGIFISILFAFITFAATPELDPDMSEIQGKELEALKWGPEKNDNVKPEAVVRKKVDCANKELHPSQPTQYLKQYHKLKRGSFDHFKITADSKFCKINNKKTMLNGPKCLKGETLEFYIASDTYEDACGNLYRGYYRRQFLQKDESQGTGWSPGHSMFERQSASGDVYDFGATVKDMVDGHTHLVKVGEDLLFVADLLPGDAEKIAEEKERAAQTHNFNKKKRIWLPIED